MANYYEPTEQNIIDYQTWVAERPDGIRQIAERFFPWKLYRDKGHHRVLVIGFAEDPSVPGGVSVKMSVLAQFNEVLTFERNVFGVDPDDLVECELPDPSIVLGEPLFRTIEEKQAFDASGASYEKLVKTRLADKVMRELAEKERIQ